MSLDLFTELNTECPICKSPDAKLNGDKFECGNCGASMSREQFQRFSNLDKAPKGRSLLAYAIFGE